MPSSEEASAAPPDCGAKLQVGQLGWWPIISLASLREREKEGVAREWGVGGVALCIVCAICIVPISIELRTIMELPWERHFVLGSKQVECHRNCSGGIAAFPSSASVGIEKQIERVIINKIVVNS